MPSTLFTRTSALAAVVTLGLSIAVGGGIAQAHDKWLEIAPVAPRQSAKIYLATGDALREAELRPERQAARVQRLDWSSAAGQRSLLPALREDTQPIAITPPLPAGTHVLRLDGAAISIELEAPKFAAYLLEERLIDVLALRVQSGQEDERGRERYSRSLKTIVQVGGQYDAVATRPLGQELEIVPLRHPLQPTPTKELAVQVLFRGQPLPGRAISIAQRYRSRTQEVFQRTDATGVARFMVEPRGEWLLRLIHMQRAADSGEPADPSIDWRSYWASLYFAFPELESKLGAPASKPSPGRGTP